MSVDYLALLKQKTGHALVGELQKLQEAPSCSKDSAHTNENVENAPSEHYRLPDGREVWLSPPETLEQGRYPGATPWVDDTVTVTELAPLTTDETLDIRAWLAFIGETDPATIEDVLRTCERFPDTKAHCLREAATTQARQIIAARAALEAAEERAAILEHDAKMKRTKAEEVAKLAEAFYNHLFGPGQATGCCYGRTGRYCAEGKRLRDAYYEAAKEAGKLA